MIHLLHWNRQVSGWVQSPVLYLKRRKKYSQNNKMAQILRLLRCI